MDIHSFFKKKSTRILLLFTLFVAFFCMFHILKPNRSFLYETAYTFTEGIPASDMPVYQQLSLSPGSYRAVISYATDTEDSAFCTFRDGTVFQGGLQADRLYLNSTDTALILPFTLLESTDNLALLVSYDGDGSLSLSSLTIQENNLLWWKLLVSTCFLCFVILFCLYWFPIHSLSKAQTSRLLGVFTISFFGSLPFWMGGVPYSAALPEQLTALTSFDCNLFFVLPALLYRIGFSLSACYVIYCMILTAATASVSTYCFAKLFASDTIALLCSGLYTLSIYRIYRLIVCGFLNEITAYAFLPLVIYGVYLLLWKESSHPSSAEKTQKSGWLFLGLGLSGIFQTHTGTFEILGGITLLLCLLHIPHLKKCFSFQQFAKGIGSFLLGSLWYLIAVFYRHLHHLPAYFTQELHTIQDKGLYPGHLGMHFWQFKYVFPDAESGMQSSVPAGLGLIFVVGLAFFLIAWFSGLYQKRKDSLLSLTKTAAFWGIFLSVLSLKLFPWDRIQFRTKLFTLLLRPVESPVLFLGCATLFLTVVIGFLLKDMKDYHRPVISRIAGLLVLACLVSSSLFLQDYIGRDLEHTSIYSTEVLEGGIWHEKEI